MASIGDPSRIAWLSSADFASPRALRCIVNEVEVLGLPLSSPLNAAPSPPRCGALLSSVTRPEVLRGTGDEKIRLNRLARVASRRALSSALRAARVSPRTRPPAASCFCSPQFRLPQAAARSVLPLPLPSCLPLFLLPIQYP